LPSEAPRQELGPGQHAAHSVLVTVAASTLLRQPLDDHEIVLVCVERSQDRREFEVGLTTARQPSVVDGSVRRKHRNEAAWDFVLSSALACAEGFEPRQADEAHERGSQ
jgi:hypothetical protein